MSSLIKILLNNKLNIINGCNENKRESFNLNDKQSNDNKNDDVTMLIYGLIYEQKFELLRTILKTLKVQQQKNEQKNSRLEQRVQNKSKVNKVSTSNTRQKDNKQESEYRLQKILKNINVKCLFEWMIGQDRDNIGDNNSNQQRLYEQQVDNSKIIDELITNYVNKQGKIISVIQWFIDEIYTQRRIQQQEIKIIGYIISRLSRQCGKVQQEQQYSKQMNRVNSNNIDDVTLSMLIPRWQLILKLAKQQKQIIVKQKLIFNTKQKQIIVKQKQIFNSTNNNNNSKVKQNNININNKWLICQTNNNITQQKYNLYQKQNLNNNKLSLIQFYNKFIREYNINQQTYLNSSINNWGNKSIFNIHHQLSNTIIIFIISYYRQTQQICTILKQIQQLRQQLKDILNKQQQSKQTNQELRYEQIIKINNEWMKFIFIQQLIKFFIKQLQNQNNNKNINKQKNEQDNEQNINTKETMNNNENEQDNKQENRQQIIQQILIILLQIYENGLSNIYNTILKQWLSIDIKSNYYLTNKNKFKIIINLIHFIINWFNPISLYQYSQLTININNRNTLINKLINNKILIFRIDNQNNYKNNSHINNNKISMLINNINQFINKIGQYLTYQQQLLASKQTNRLLTIQQYKYKLQSILPTIIQHYFFMNSQMNNNNNNKNNLNNNLNNNKNNIDNKDNKDNISEYIKQIFIYWYIYNNNNKITFINTKQLNSILFINDNNVFVNKSYHKLYNHILSKLITNHSSSINNNNRTINNNNPSINNNNNPSINNSNILKLIISQILKLKQQCQQQQNQCQQQSFLQQTFQFISPTFNNQYLSFNYIYGQNKQTYFYQNHHYSHILLNLYQSIIYSLTYNLNHNQNQNYNQNQHNNQNQSNNNQNQSNNQNNQQNNQNNNNNQNNSNEQFLYKIFNHLRNELGNYAKDHLLQLNSKPFYQYMNLFKFCYITFNKKLLSFISIDQLILTFDLLLNQIIIKQNHPLLRQYVEIIMARIYFTIKQKTITSKSQLIKNKFYNIRNRMVNMLDYDQENMHNLNIGVPVLIILGHQLIDYLQNNYHQISKLPLLQQSIENNIQDQYGYKQIKPFHQLDIHYILIKYITCHVAYMRTICQYYLSRYQLLTKNKHNQVLLTNLVQFWYSDKDSIKIMSNISPVVQGFKKQMTLFNSHQRMDKFILHFQRVQQYPTQQTKYFLLRDTMSVFENIMSSNICQQSYQLRLLLAQKIVKLKQQAIKYQKQAIKQFIQTQNKKLKQVQQVKVVKNRQYNRKLKQHKKQLRLNKKQIIQQVKHQIISTNIKVQQPLNKHNIQQITTKISRKLQKDYSYHQNTKQPTVIIIATLLQKVHNFGYLVRTLTGHNAMLVVPSPVPFTHPQCKQLLPSQQQIDVKVIQIRPRHLQSFIKMYQHRGYPLIALEQCSKSIQLQKTVFPDKYMLLLGNERIGAPASLLNMADILVQIPQVGKIRSLNVHVSMVICFWQYLKQSKQKQNKKGDISQE